MKAQTRDRGREWKAVLWAGFGCLLALLLVCALSSCEKKPAALSVPVPLQAPDNLRIEGVNVLYWDAVENASGYTVSIGGNYYETKENCLDVFPYFRQERTYVVRVQAKNEQETSAWSTPLQYQMKSDVEWVYYKNRSGTAYSVGVAPGTTPRGIILLPAVHPEDKKPVVSSYRYTFRGCTEITGLIFPDDSGRRHVTSFEFEGCTGLQKVILPETVTAIDTAAFENCTSLEWIEMPKSCEEIQTDAFSGCVSLKSITLPADLKVINGQAFQNCELLTSVIIPKSVTLVKGRAFAGCDSMRAMTVESGNPRYRSEKNCLNDKVYNAVVFGNQYSTIPPSILTLADGCFAESKGLCEVVIPASVKYIRQGSFYGCTDLKTVVLGENVKRIGGLCAIPDFPEGNYDTFGDCPLLTEINFPASLEFVYSGTFKGCVNLEKLTVSPDNPVYRSEGNCLIIKNSNVLWMGIKTSVIPDNISMICGGAFQNCGAGVIAIPESTKKVGGVAFYNCKDLIVLLPEGVENIATNAFNHTGAVYTTVQIDNVPQGWGVDDDGKKADWMRETPVVYGCQFADENGVPYLDFLTVSYEEKDDEGTPVRFLMSVPSEILSPFRNGYTFVGFATTPGGEAVYLPTDGKVLTTEEWLALTPGTVLYAVWRAEE